MTDLDLTKPLRLKDTKERFYPCFGLGNGTFFRGLRDDAPVVENGEGRFHVHGAFSHELENVPEPLVRYIRVQLGTDTHNEVAALFGSLYQSLPRKDNDPDLHPDLRGTALLKLTRDENGKTHVEVIDG